MKIAGVGAHAAEVRRTFKLSSRGGSHAAGMTVKESLLKVVTPANAGVQTLIRDKVKCCSNFETVNK